MKASIFVGISVDGFIARVDGSFDFLPEGGGEPHGYEEFMESVDGVVIGRSTYETVLSLGGWHYGDKPVFVLSNHPIAPPPPQAIVEHLSGAPSIIVSELAKRGIEHVYVDGGRTIQEFLREGLIQDLTITLVPVLIGTGISLFGPVFGDIQLKHVMTRQFASGLVQSKYQVIADL